MNIEKMCILAEKIKTNPNNDKFLEEFTKEIRKNRAKILNEFSIAYLAHLHAAEDSEIDLNDIVMNEQFDHSKGLYKLWFSYEPKEKIDGQSIDKKIE